MRDHKEEFDKRDIHVIVFGPETREDFRKFWEEKDMPFIGIPEAKAIMEEYGQENRWYKLGRMPFQIAFDREGFVLKEYKGKSMKDIPSVEEIVSLYKEKEKS